MTDDPIKDKVLGVIDDYVEEDKSFKKKHDKVKGELAKVKLRTIIAGAAVGLILLFLIVNISITSKAPAPEITQTTEINMVPAVPSMPAPVVIVNDTLSTDHVVDVQVITPAVEKTSETPVLEPARPAQVPEVPPIVRINIKPPPKAEKPPEPAQKEPVEVVETYSQFSFFGAPGCALLRKQRTYTE